MYRKIRLVKSGFHCNVFFCIAPLALSCALKKMHCKNHTKNEKEGRAFQKVEIGQPRKQNEQQKLERLKADLWRTREPQFPETGITTYKSGSSADKLGCQIELQISAIHLGLSYFNGDKLCLCGMNEDEDRLLYFIRL